MYSTIPLLQQSRWHSGCKMMSQILLFHWLVVCRINHQTMIFLAGHLLMEWPFLLMLKQSSKFAHLVYFWWPFLLWFFPEHTIWKWLLKLPRHKCTRLTTLQIFINWIFPCIDGSTSTHIPLHATAGLGFDSKDTAKTLKCGFSFDSCERLVNFLGFDLWTPAA